MSCKISVSGWNGSDKTVVSKKISKMFRMESGKALKIMRKLDTGIPWNFDRPVSDKQGKEARTFLVSLGFRVALIGVNNGYRSMGLGVNPYNDQEDFEEIPLKKGFLSRLKEKIVRKGE